MNVSQRQEIHAGTALANHSSGPRKEKEDANTSTWVTTRLLQAVPGFSMTTAQSCAQMVSFQLTAQETASRALRVTSVRTLRFHPKSAHQVSTRIQSARLPARRAMLTLVPISITLSMEPLHAKNLQLVSQPPRAQLFPSSADEDSIPGKVIPAAVTAMLEDMSAKTDQSMTNPCHYVLEG